MKENLFLIFFIIIIFLLIIFIIYNNLNLKIYESFNNENENKNYDCNKFFEDNSFCNLNVDTGNCECNYQKDESRYIFNSPESCCKRVCAKRTPSECVNNTQGTKMDYYCNVAGKCNKYVGTVNENHIMANSCGIDPLNNQLLLPYASLKECEGSLDPCDVYNNPSKTASENRAECTKDFNCGYCTNDSGGGKCISGTASGPNDLQKYFYCNPTGVSDVNKYIYGNHSATLLQRANIGSFSNVPS